MRAKSMLLILIALGCGLVASIAISQVMERGAKPGNAALEVVQIYVATADIDVNEQLTASNVRVEDWPKSKVPDGVIVDFKDIDERFARMRFYQGEPILKAKLANGIDGPAIKIPDGHRVCSLKVQVDTAVAGLVNPGDRVDIFGYFKEGRGVPRTGTRKILKNVRVFAVNDQTEQEVDQEGRSIAAKTVSVLVEEGQVAKLMLATELGTLRLALRRPNETMDDKDDQGETATVESLFGTRADTADSGSSNAANTLAAATNGLVGFLNGLKSRPAEPIAATPTPTSEGQVAGPVWQMTLLTPEGGTEFSWNHENELPATGGSGVTTAPALPSPGQPPAFVPTTPVPVRDEPAAHDDAGQLGNTTPIPFSEPIQPQEKD